MDTIKEARRSAPGVAIAVLALGLAACSGGSPASADGGADAGTDSGADGGAPIPLTAVDLLVVIDDTSASTVWADPVLGRNLFAFTGSLLHPPAGSPYAAIDDIRIAVATPNLGVSAGGEPMDDLWPHSPSAQCVGLGNNGKFQDVVVPFMELPNDSIPCDATAAQCPPGWACRIEGDGGVEGVCHTDGDPSVECPALEGDAWAETTAGEANADFPTLAGCLAIRTGWGCVQQPLRAAYVALTRADQAAFVRDDALLALLLMTNEEDCSMEDGPGMIEDLSPDGGLVTFDVACNLHHEHLYTAADLFDSLVAARGRADAVVFAAIAGVPFGDQPGAAACEGSGDALGGCLEQDEMQIELDDGDNGFVAYTCQRFAGDNIVAYAWPSRRFVELATEFGANGYVYSICNEDWSPAFAALGAMIRGKLAAGR